MKEEENCQIKVALLLFDGMDLLGFAGPAEVFSTTEEFEVYTVGLNKDPVACENSITILPAYALDDCPRMDILVVPGGNIGPLLQNQQLLCWIRACSIKARHVLSIYNGAGLLAKAGLLNKREVTTSYNYHDTLQKLAPSAVVLSNTRMADTGQVITTSGVTAGIDGALQLVSRLKGKKAAQQTADQLEYNSWQGPI